MKAHWYLNFFFFRIFCQFIMFIKIKLWLVSINLFLKHNICIILYNITSHTFKLLNLLVGTYIISISFEINGNWNLLYSSILFMLEFNLTLFIHFYWHSWNNKDYIQYLILWYWNNALYVCLRLYLPPLFSITVSF